MFLKEACLWFIPITCGYMSCNHDLFEAGRCHGASGRSRLAKLIVKEKKIQAFVTHSFMTVLLCSVTHPWWDFSDEIEHVVSGGGGPVDGPPPGSFLPFRTAGCVTKQQLSGLSGQAACKEDRGDFRILFQEVWINNDCARQLWMLWNNLNEP